MASVVKLTRQPEVDRVVSRTPVNLGATIRDDALRPIEVIVHDLSSMGFMVQSIEPLVIDSLVRVGLSGIGEKTARVVWADGNLYGCAFMQELTSEQVEEAQVADTVRLVDFNPLPTPGEPAGGAPHSRPNLAVIGALTVVSWVATVAAVIGVSRL